MEQGFYEIANIPNILGAIDGSLINIIAPHNDENVFVDRKGNHSFNIVCICDSSMMYTYAVVKYGGSAHDSYVFENSQLYSRFERGIINNGHLIGDSGYL